MVILSLVLATVASSFSGPGLGRPYVDDAHEFSIRPPEAWVQREGVRPVVVKFAAPGRRALPCELMVIHYHSANPTPLASFLDQARAKVRADFPGVEITGERTFTLDGLPAAQFAFTRAGILHVKTFVRRTNLEYYLLDAMIPAKETAAWREDVLSAIGSFELVAPRVPGSEIEGAKRWRAYLETEKIRPELLGERWQTVALAQRAVGYRREKVFEENGRYVFEIDLELDLGAGGRDRTVSRGTFSADGRFQRIDVEQTKTHRGERWQFRASATIHEGTLEATRNMNGYKETVSREVGEGVVFSDVAALYRRALVLAGKGTRVMSVVSPYADEPSPEEVEVNAVEKMEINGKRQPVSVVFAHVDRRKNLFYYYSPDGRLLRLGAPNKTFWMHDATKADALGKMGR